MSTLSHYGALLREAFAALHGGCDEEAPEQPGGSAPEETTPEALPALLTALRSVEPPVGMARVHDLLLELLRAAQEAEVALAAQAEAYRAGRLRESVEHSDRLQAVVARGARIDRELMAALREAEVERPGTLAELGLADVVQPLNMNRHFA